MVLKSECQSNDEHVSFRLKGDSAQKFVFAAETNKSGYFPIVLCV